MTQFTQTTNDLSNLSKIILMSKRERIIRKPAPKKIVRRSKNIVMIRTAIVRSIQKETGQDADTARAIMKIRGLK